MNIIGLNAFHGDASACLVVDGQLVAAAEEERFRRIKHCAGLPIEALRYCLQEGRLEIDRIDHIAINRKPSAHVLRKALFALLHNPSWGTVASRLRNAGKVRGLREQIAEGLGADKAAIRAQIHNVEHHLAHLASAFLVSPFEEAAIVSVDGFGDFASALWGVGKGNRIIEGSRTFYPHSLGLFYLAITQHLGFPNYGDEYKVMGLAPYGESSVLKEMRELVKLLPDGQFQLGLRYFRHHSQGVSMTWADGEPRIGKVYSHALEELLGPSRREHEALEDRHRDIAASAQAMYEEAFFHILGHVRQVTGMRELALAGGCAMNSVANGKILERGEFSSVYVQSAAGDAGGAIGAAFAVWNDKLKQPRVFAMDHAYWGPEFSRADIESLLQRRRTEIASQECLVEWVEDEDVLCSLVAQAIFDGRVVGWFQGRMEWGPRALGNRSILGDPRRGDMKDILNLKIKRRESFRPFAPSILRECVKDWFETDCDVPFMLQVLQVRSERRKLIPAVTHVNGSGRLQTVAERQNRRYYKLIGAFRKLSGIPIVLNTSFNENEPVVCTPEEALSCFLRTRMDVLVLGNHVIRREPRA